MECAAVDEPAAPTAMETEAPTTRATLVLTIEMTPQATTPTMANCRASVDESDDDARTTTGWTPRSRATKTEQLQSRAA